MKKITLITLCTLFLFGISFGQGAVGTLIPQNGTTDYEWYIGGDQEMARLYLSPTPFIDWKIEGTGNKLYFGWRAPFYDFTYPMILDDSGNLTLTNNLNFGNQVRQMLNLWGKQFGIGVQAYTQYFRTNRNFAWYSGGIHEDIELNAGGGQTLMTLSANGGLDVNGNVNILKDEGQLKFGKRLGLHIALYGTEYGIGIEKATQYFKSKKKFRWYQGSTELMRLGKDGNLKGTGSMRFAGRADKPHVFGHSMVIGDDDADEMDNTPYTDYRLWVHGGIVGTDIAISEVAGWETQDVVFEEDYKLKSLSEVEEFINKNGHLHTVKSAEKFWEEGYRAKDLDFSLLRTVEELTLHAIEQEKTIKAQNATIENLTERIVKLDTSK